MKLIRLFIALVISILLNVVIVTRYALHLLYNRSILHIIVPLLVGSYFSFKIIMSGAEEGVITSLFIYWLCFVVYAHILLIDVKSLVKNIVSFKYLTDFINSWKLAKWVKRILFMLIISALLFLSFIFVCKFQLNKLILVPVGIGLCIGSYSIFLATPIVEKQGGTNE